MVTLSLKLSNPSYIQNPKLLIKKIVSMQIDKNG